jgi:hypothetical protein
MNTAILRTARALLGQGDRGLAVLRGLLDLGDLALVERGLLHVDDRVHVGAAGGDQVDDLQRANRLVHDRARADGLRGPRVDAVHEGLHGHAVELALLAQELLEVELLALAVVLLRGLHDELREALLLLLDLALGARVLAARPWRGRPCRRAGTS